MPLLKSGKVDIGQLFRCLDRLAAFELLDVRRCPNGRLRKEHVLECNAMSFRIQE